jgi:hypothetical protein
MVNVAAVASGAEPNKATADSASHLSLKVLNPVLEKPE